MKKTQATRCTKKELAYADHWKSKGFFFRPGDKIPMNTTTPPGFETNHPILSAILGGLILAFAVGGMVAMWVSKGAGL